MCARYYNMAPVCKAGASAAKFLPEAKPLACASLLGLLCIAHLSAIIEANRGFRACDSCANGNKPGSSHNPGILESVLNRRISNRRISNFEVPVSRRSYVCGSIFVIRHSAVCFQLPLPANRHRLFNPAPPEAMPTYYLDARRSRLASGPGGLQQSAPLILSQALKAAASCRTPKRGINNNAILARGPVLRKSEC